MAVAPLTLRELPQDLGSEVTGTVERLCSGNLDWFLDADWRGLTVLDYWCAANRAHGMTTPDGLSERRALGIAAPGFPPRLFVVCALGGPPLVLADFSRGLPALLVAGAGLEPTTFGL